MSKFGLRGYRGVAVVFWALTVVTVLLFISSPTDRSGWDMRVYGGAIVSLHAGRDPYVDGMDAQRVFHSELALHPHADLPYSYLYSPLTLVPLRWLGHLPLRVDGGLYWLGYIAGVFGLAWAWMQVAEEKERGIFLLLEPAALFFPGLMLEDDVLFSGNLAYLLYGLIFVMAVRGWRRGEWRWFYVSVLAASCFKFPMLTLLAIPVVSARGQWWRAMLAMVAGVLVLAVQPWLWRSEFQHYLEAVQLEFRYNHGYGTAPAGVVANALYSSAHATVLSGLVYVLYALPVAGALLYLSRRFFAGRFSVERWMPVVLVGAMLLNPRLMEYDVAAIALPMAMIVWRHFGRGRQLGGTILRVVAFVGAINVAGVWAWKPTEAAVLVGVFALGCGDLWQIGAVV